MEQSLRAVIEQAEFKESFRGYDRAQVDDTLEQLASQAGKLETELAKAISNLETAESRVRAEAEAEVEARVQAKLTAGGAAPVRNEEQDAEEVRLTLVMAQRTADAAIAEARVKAEELLDAARTDALRTTADARSEGARERQEGRKRLASEVVELEGVRTTLQGDVDVLEHHIGQQREQLSAAIDQLRKLLDDPAAFRPSKRPSTSAVTVENEDPPTKQPEKAAEPKRSQKASAGSGSTTNGNAATGSTASAPKGTGSAPPRNTPAEPEEPVEVEPAPTGRRSQKPTGAADAKATIDHIDPGGTDSSKVSAESAQRPGDAARPTGPLGSADAAHEEDAFLSELRKAMTDDEPLGPRDQSSTLHAADRTGSAQSGGATDDHLNRPRNRFGRRQ